jgi:hypothetical protein
MSEPPDPSESAEATENLPGRRGVRAALVGLHPPNPGDKFWNSLEEALDEQDQLDIITRPAVRSISEPPPISQPTLDDDPRNALAAYRPSGMPRRLDGTGRKTRDPEESRKRRVIAVGALAVVLVVLIAAAVLGGGDDPPPAAAPPTSVDPQIVPTTVPGVPGLDPSMPMTAMGLGPLVTGMTLADLQDSGAATVVDQATFDASGGTCFDVRLPGAPDLTLRFHSATATGVADPREGRLGSVNIDAIVGSARVTDTGVGLGATEEQVAAAHAGSVTANDHPFIPGGNIFLVRTRDGTGTGIAYVTDGQKVTEISVGDATVIRLRQACA